jgi:hypothetical protein
MNKLEFNLDDMLSNRSKGYANFEFTIEDNVMGVKHDCNLDSRMIMAIIDHFMVFAAEHNRLDEMMDQIEKRYEKIKDGE